MKKSLLISIIIGLTAFITYIITMVYVETGGKYRHTLSTDNEEDDECSCSCCSDCKCNMKD